MIVSSSANISESPNPSDNKCVLIVFNPVSGREDPEKRRSAISEALASHGYTCQFMVTSKEQGAGRIVADALKEGVKLVVACGGDGTVMEAASALVGSNVPLAVIPAGTGNLFSVNLGIPATIPEAVDTALSGHVYKLDLVRRDGGKYFAIMGGMGLDAQIIADADRQAKDKFGVWAYFWAALKNSTRPHVSIEVCLDGGKPIRKRAKTVMLANMGKMTGGLEAVPTAVPDDGLIDVCVVRPETLRQWLRLVGYALIGRTQDDPNCDVYQGRKVTIRATPEQPVEFDGEDCGRAANVTVEVVPKAVGILLPEDAPAARDTKEAPIKVTGSMARRFAPALLLALALLGAAWMIRRRGKQ